MVIWIVVTGRWLAGEDVERIRRDGGKRPSASVGAFDPARRKGDKGRKKEVEDGNGKMEAASWTWKWECSMVGVVVVVLVVDLEVEVEVVDADAGPFVEWRNAAGGRGGEKDWSWSRLPLCNCTV